MEEMDMANTAIPKDLEDFLLANNITYADYVNYVKNTDKSKFEPKIQVIARDIYHKLRKF